MSDVVSVGRRLTSLDVSPQFQPYTKVIIHTGDETAIEVGNDTGRTLEIDNPFGTQAMAQNLLDRLTGYQYQPYSAEGVVLDPAAEIGDAANMRGNYGGIFSRSRSFGRLMKADISAPYDEEIDHEYTFESPTERKFTRQINDVKASLIIANNSIEAKVSQTGGNKSSFGWVLDATSHKWYAGNKEVMKVDANGLTVKGVVEATSGKIGGFTLSATALYTNNMSSMSSTQTTGVYVGTDGIKLGKTFKVTSAGAVTATNLTVDTLYIGNTVVSAATLNSRANSAYNWTSSNGSYVYGGASGGYGFQNAQSRSSPVGSFYASSLGVFGSHEIYENGYFRCFGRMYMGYTQLTLKTKNIAGTQINYLGWGT